MGTVSISLPQELVTLLEEKVASGMYLSISEVVGEGLLLLKEQDARLVRRESLRKELAIAEKQIENGEVIQITSTKEYAEKIIAESKRLIGNRGKA